jgi:hypothetical protein
MKPSLIRYRFLFVLAALLIFVMSCREISVTTKVFPNGSCERIVAVKGDSSGIADAYFPIPHDSSWKIVGTRTGQDHKYLYSATKTFRTVRDLNQEFQAPADSVLQVNCVVDLQKRFRWFYTFIKYQETYKAYNPFKLVPLSDYFTPDEIQRHLAGVDTTEVEKKKGDKWQESAIFEEYYQALLNGAKSLNDPALTPGIIASHKDSLIAAFVDSVIGDNSSADRALRAAERVLHTKTVWQLTKPFEKVAHKMDFVQDMMTDSYTNTVVMPGLITDTNAEKIEGSQVSWNTDGDHFYLSDFEMWVESRVVNKWAIVMTGVVLVLFAFGIAIAIWRQRRKAAM